MVCTRPSPCRAAEVSRCTLPETRALGCRGPDVVLNWWAGAGLSQRSMSNRGLTRALSQRLIKTQVRRRSRVAGACPALTRGCCVRRAEPERARQERAQLQALAVPGEVRVLPVSAFAVRGARVFSSHVARAYTLVSPALLRAVSVVFCPGAERSRLRTRG